MHTRHGTQYSFQRVVRCLGSHIQIDGRVLLMACALQNEPVSHHSTYSSTRVSFFPDCSTRQAPAQCPTSISRFCPCVGFVYVLFSTVFSPVVRHSLCDELHWSISNFHVYAGFPLTHPRTACCSLLSPHCPLPGTPNCYFSSRWTTKDNASRSFCFNGLFALLELLAG